MTSTNVSVPFLDPDPLLAHRWSRQKSEAWMTNAGWLVGCNYIPANAINQIEMWGEESFSPALIDKELGWAASLGFNTVRVFLHHLVWEENSEAFLGRIREYLSIAHSHGIRTMFVLFDAVWNPFPRPGIQPQPKHNVHNSGWVQCPGYDVLNNPANYDGLHGYVHGIVSAFAHDERVLIWDLYNEPDNMNLGSYKDDDYIVHKAELSMALLKKTIGWVRDINPVQPITMAPWQNDWSCDTKITALDNYMFSHSDIASFHCYEDRKGMEVRIREVKRYGRPMLCTEYMARPLGSTFEDILPLFREHGIGAYSWGLVAGKTQTHCPWDSWHTKYEEEPSLWFHDVFRENGEPYRKEEVAFLQGLLKTEGQEVLQVA